MDDHDDQGLAYAIARLLQSLDEAEPWRRDALCRERDPGPFFVRRGESADPARATCARCLVTAECRAYAIDHGVREGIWGGTSATERRALRAEEREAA